MSSGFGSNISLHFTIQEMMMGFEDWGWGGGGGDGQALSPSAMCG